MTDERILTELRGVRDEMATIRVEMGAMRDEMAGLRDEIRVLSATVLRSRAPTPE
jgi:hypothetical protein